MLILLNRIIKNGLLNFKRNGLVSWSAILVMTVTLSVVTTLLLLQNVLNVSLEQLKEKVDVTIYFNTDASIDKIQKLKISIESLPEVREVSFTSAEDSLKIFREKHKDDYLTIQTLNEIKINPLGAYLNIKAKDVSQYEVIANYVKSDEILSADNANIIYKINYFQNKPLIDRLTSIISGSKKFGFLLTLLFIAISILITFNTIRLTIFISKEEIGIMRLVGASKTRVRGPFLVESTIYGILSTILTIIIFLFITYWLGKNMTGFLGVNLYKYYLNNIFEIISILLLFGISVGVISSFLAINKYLDKRNEK